ncbi:MAG: thermonuclease family protein [Pseudomonadota bacterium]
MKRTIATIIVLLALGYLAFDYYKSDSVSHIGVVTHVRDGDTIEIGDEVFRLAGISAPERSDEEGNDATTFMKGLVLAKEVDCEPTGDMSHDRFVAVCFIDGEDIGEAIIEAGLARDCPRHSHGRYEDAEKRAIESGHNLSATYELPGYCIPK